MFASALMIFLAAGAAQAASVPSIPSAILKGESLFESGRSSSNLGTLLEARSIFQDCVTRNPADFRCLYDRARTDVGIQHAQAISGNKGEAARWLDTAISDTQAAIGSNGASADAHALLADLYGQKIDGMFSGMRYGPKANAELTRAFQIDPHNAMAFAAQGRKFLYSPAAFGGNVDKALQSFQEAVTADPRSDDDYVWLAIAWRKKGDLERERECLAQALRINPQSVFAQRVLQNKE
jgi:tetratricopeptide (TPR) repeat protein